MQVFILMWHDPEGHNLAYLYAHSQVVDTVGEGMGAVDIVQTTGQDLAEAEYLARYQMGRLSNGLQHRGDPRVFQSIDDAHEHARLVYDNLTH